MGFFSSFKAANNAAPPQQEFTMEDVAARSSDSREMIRAREILAERRVGTCTVHRDGTRTWMIRGSGSSEYRTIVRPDLTGNCSCPSYRKSGRQFCKHMAAAAMAWLGGSLSVEQIDPELAAAVDALGPEVARSLLVDAAGRDRRVRERIISGVWPSDNDR